MGRKRARPLSGDHRHSTGGRHRARGHPPSLASARMPHSLLWEGSLHPPSLVPPRNAVAFGGEGAEVCVTGIKVPSIVTENGIAPHDDQRKTRFIKRHVDALEKSRKHGIDARGYFYWSLPDNYEWLKGFDARFGLYRVEFQTLARFPTQAATYYCCLIRKNRPL